MDINTPEPRSRSLGLILDTHLSLNDHRAKVWESSYFHLRNISKIRKLLTKHSTEILTRAFFS